ncbi:MAG: tRNA pseudouridine(38-40) synthase TruA [Actinomycetes bacterium]
MTADEPAPDLGGGLVRVRLDVAYDGSDFHGWARQPGLRTVEQTLAQALSTALRLTDAPHLVVAGRTDAGVHARGQVVHVDVPVGAWASERDQLLGRLRGLLPDDTRVSAAGQAPQGFDARFSALWRRYRYALCDAVGGVDPLRRHDVVVNRRPLDVDAMNAASVPLLGEHDFLAFCRPREGASTVRELRELSWTRTDGLVVARVVADAFCHHMVRALVGTLVAVGEGRRPITWPAELLAAEARSSAVMVMPAHGLVLEEVAYPPDDQLAERAGQSRRLRGSAGSGEPTAEPSGIHPDDSARRPDLDQQG